MSEANNSTPIAHRKLTLRRVLALDVPLWYDLLLICLTAGVIICPKSYSLLWICFGFSTIRTIWKLKWRYDYFYYKRAVCPKKPTPEESWEVC